MQTIYVHTDGGSRGNPGPSGAGVYISDGKGNMIKEVAKFLGKGTNNVAEYMAVVIALQTLHKLYKEKTKDVRFEIRMDSQLVERQLNGVYRVKDITLKELHTKIQHMREMHFPHIAFLHVRREQNEDADRLANDAMDAMK